MQTDGAEYRAKTWVLCNALLANVVLFESVMVIFFARAGPSFRAHLGLMAAMLSFTLCFIAVWTIHFNMTFMTETSSDDDGGESAISESALYEEALDSAADEGADRDFLRDAGGPIRSFISQETIERAYEPPVFTRFDHIPGHDNWVHSQRVPDAGSDDYSDADPLSGAQEEPPHNVKQPASEERRFAGEGFTLPNTQETYDNMDDGDGDKDGDEAFSADQLLRDIHSSSTV